MPEFDRFFRENLKKHTYLKGEEPKRTLLAMFDWSTMEVRVNGNLIEIAINPLKIGKFVGVRGIKIKEAEAFFPGKRLRVVQTTLVTMREEEKDFPAPKKVEIRDSRRSIYDAVQVDKKTINSIPEWRRVDILSDSARETRWVTPWEMRKIGGSGK